MTNARPTPQQMADALKVVSCWWKHEANLHTDEADKSFYVGKADDAERDRQEIERQAGL